MKMKSKVTGRGEKIKEINFSCDGMLNLVKGNS